MRWYWAISWDNTVQNQFVSSTEDINGHEEREFRNGQYVESWNPEAWIRCAKAEWDGEPDDVVQTHLNLPIYSPRLQEVIGKAGFSGIQFLPIRVLHLNGNEIPGFAVANILNVPPVMDMEQSLYDKFADDYFAPEDRGRVSGVYRMVLKQKGLEGCDIIRVREFHQSVYVSERFKQEFETAQCTGYSFQEVRLT